MKSCKHLRADIRKGTTRKLIRMVAKRAGTIRWRSTHLLVAEPVSEATRQSSARRLVISE
jgi:hypothetical protein